MKTTVNKIATVTLTDFGISVLTDAWYKIISNEVDYRLEGKEFKTRVWSLMAIFGDYYWNSRYPVFEGNIIDIED